MRDNYRYVIELFRATGEALGQVALTPDWEPAVECARFAGLRALGRWATQSGAALGVVPLWHRELGEPYVDGFRVHLAVPDEREWCEDFPATPYFGDEARAAVAKLVEEGTLGKGDRAVYRLTAFARPGGGQTETGPLTFDAAETTPPLALRQTALSSLLASSTLCGEHDYRDAHVFLPHELVEETEALTQRAGAQETGGILIGLLHRDPVTNDVFIEATAQIPARHTQSDAVQLTFTSDTWTDVRNTMSLRDRGETMLGWWHSHPAIEWCKRCSPDSQRGCRLARGFLSAEDRALHRAMFPRAFGVALVITHAATGVGATLFGWRSGLLEPRGFRLLGGAREVAASHHAAHTRDRDADHILTGGPHAASSAD